MPLRSGCSSSMPAMKLSISSVCSWPQCGQLRPAAGVLLGRVDVEEVAGVEVQRAEGEHGRDDRAADLRALADGDDAAGAVRPQGLVNLVNGRNRFGLYGPGNCDSRSEKLTLSTAHFS